MRPDNYSEMYEEFLTRMYSKYPTLYTSSKGSFWGFEVGPGWWPLIEGLSSTIAAHENHLRKYDTTEFQPVVVAQIKEKFGNLRFYHYGGDEFVTGAVSLAEHLSGTICEQCGAPGKARTEGWIKTLCEVHHEERQQRLQKHIL